ncbi:hypothetical protein [Pedobacter frigiditerrae]|uniref:hypothetical protein n=1 Tax=Pedobacter frigiditerrae TaxID=2530452 RepID=UPI002930FD0F|nr:hypothetical protein [Pedobacter frigiditerrae]
MAFIPSVQYFDSNSDWLISIKDLEINGRNKKNPLKLNLDINSNQCKYLGCPNIFLRTRTSGLCNDHHNHQHDIFLDVYNFNAHISSPTHAQIINNLIDWSKSRNFDLINFFKDCSFTILGNVPDISTISKEINHTGFVSKNLSAYLDICIECVNRHFPSDNNSSYQKIKIKNIEYPARVLAIIFVGLLLCEESNRGDRWFWREIIKDESRTTLLGGAMPIAYFASMNFPWGMEIGKAAPKFIPSGI